MRLPHTRFSESLKAWGRCRGNWQKVRGESEEAASRRDPSVGPSLSRGMKVKAAQSCPTLCDPIDCKVHGILQTRILEWVAVPFSRGVFPAQGPNPGLLHCRQILYQPRHEGSPSCGVETPKLRPFYGNAAECLGLLSLRDRPTSPPEVGRGSLPMGRLCLRPAVQGSLKVSVRTEGKEPSWASRIQYRLWGWMMDGSCPTPLGLSQQSLRAGK